MSSFNRTSFQQQLKLLAFCGVGDYARFNRTSFQQQLKPREAKWSQIDFEKLQSYILSTTTETNLGRGPDGQYRLQSYILSTTTETHVGLDFLWCAARFNRTSFQQQLKRVMDDLHETALLCFNRTSFQQQLKR